MSNPYALSEGYEALKFCVPVAEDVSNRILDLLLFYCPCETYSSRIDCLRGKWENVPVEGLGCKEKGGVFYDEIELRERERVALHDGRNACQKAAPRTEWWQLPGMHCIASLSQWGHLISIYKFRSVSYRPAFCPVFLVFPSFNRHSVRHSLLVTPSRQPSWKLTVHKVFPKFWKCI